MAKEIKKTLEEILNEPSEPVINQAHIDDWHFCTSSGPFTRLQTLLPQEKLGTFNMQAAITTPKSIRYRQRNVNFDNGVVGDYVLVDRSGGKVTIPYKVFKSLF